MKKKIVSRRYCLLQVALLFFVAMSCSRPETKAPKDAYASSSDIPDMAVAPENMPEEEAYHPLLWEIKWSSKRVLDFGENYEKICKTAFTNPYKKMIKEIKIGYEVKGQDEEAEHFQKTVELNLLPGQSKVIDTGVGCNDFFMFEVIFSDGSTI